MDIGNLRGFDQEAGKEMLVKSYDVSATISD
jgi:hypothetical protein